ncbi:unnamed protein product [Prorocentrum cordatum]|uniref:Uncharacterized protein n=1 Tax=Prorocentrum cordatum TaxID=2364126 RepID=A0ABN9PXP5_9DINO|nr:unnamed protein product [Polarella glacialis]
MSPLAFENRADSRESSVCYSRSGSAQYFALAARDFGSGAAGRALHGNSAILRISAGIEANPESFKLVFIQGKSSSELLEEHRRRAQDRAVCTGGKKDYARRPVSFQVALPREQGSASHQLAQDETAVQPRRGADPRRDRSRSPELVRSAHSAEYQDRMRRLFEKYGMARAATAEEQKWRGIEGPDVLRLG